MFPDAIIRLIADELFSSLTLSPLALISPSQLNIHHLFSTGINNRFGIKDNSLRWGGGKLLAHKHTIFVLLRSYIIADRGTVKTGFSYLAGATQQTHKMHAKKDVVLHEIYMHSGPKL